MTKKRKFLTKGAAYIAAGEFEFVVQKPNMKGGITRIGTLSSKSDGGFRVVEINRENNPKIFGAIIALYQAMAKEANISKLPSRWMFD